MAPLKESNRALGLGFFIVGLLFVGINLGSRYTADTWFPKLMISGIVITFLGLGMILFPPKNTPLEKSADLKAITSKTPRFHIIMWILFLIASIFVVIWTLDQFNYHL